MSPEFTTPPPQAFVDAFGVEPTAEGEHGYTLYLSEITGQDITFSYNAMMQSVALFWTPSAEGIPIRIHREGATLLRILEEFQKTKIVVEFRTEDTIGHMTLQVFPSLEFHEETLIT
ncbi:hypothetical protein [Streptomyces sp. AB3(2024)]|uniref:hypothetical protein n=1 Tax=Streptomyces sp. AB3(2024) TaxID=3317321 RepID=UPI0035A30B9A